MNNTRFKIRVNDKFTKRMFDFFERNYPATNIFKALNKHYAIKKIKKQPFYKPIIGCLCQDCLRIYPYTDKRHNGLELCECGGDLCGCGSCTDTIKQLKSGELDAKKLGILGDNIKSWTSEKGLE